MTNLSLTMSGARATARFLAVTGFAVFLWAGCWSASTPVQPTDTAVAQTSPVTAADPRNLPVDMVVYASDLTSGALTDELTFWDEPASPGGKMIGIPNTGDELDPPPENDPHVTFQVQVQSGIPYRCWIHMKVGVPKGKSQANVVWVQFSEAVDKAGQEVFKPGSSSYLTAQGPAQEGWTWVGCDLANSGAARTLVYFQTRGEITVRLQAGMEGVGLDQFVLSPAQYLDGPPAEAVVKK